MSIPVLFWEKRDQPVGFEEGCDLPGELIPVLAVLSLGQIRSPFLAASCLGHQMRWVAIVNPMGLVMDQVRPTGHKFLSITESTRLPGQCFIFPIVLSQFVFRGKPRSPGASGSESQWL